MDFSPFGAAVPFDVSKPFLGDPKKTERYFRRNATRNVLVYKVDLYFLLVRKLLTEGLHPCNQT
jgi:hypothetical protein